MKTKINLSHNKLSLALALSLGISQVVHAQFTSPFPLSGLNGNNGYVIHGEGAGNLSGRSVSSAGDINGDGLDDLIIGAHFAGSVATPFAGKSYVVFGSTSALPDTLNLSDLNGTNGFVIHGANTDDISGSSVSSAGDINDDGLDDLIIGASFADPNGIPFAGSSYVVFGSSSGFPSSLNLSELDGSNGFVMHGENENDLSGDSVSSAGDINGDGVDDLIIGAARTNSLTGSSYVVFGSSSALPVTLDLSTLDGSNGFVIHGENANDFFGDSVSSAGDINGDGVDDLIVGAYGASPNKNSLAGSSYVVFGSTSGFSDTFNLSELNGSNGFVMHGEDEFNASGRSVSSAGDINGDGIADLIVGANFANGVDDEGSAGRSYVVFGSSSGFSDTLNLSELNGSNGFIIYGETFFDYSGSSVSSAGDINGDGLDDLIVGAFGVDLNGDFNVGGSYVIFGSSSGFSGTLNLSGIDGSNGFVIHGENEYDFSGSAVSSAGDVNGDGLDDLIVGAEGADPNGNAEVGSSYVIFGQEQPIFKDGFEG